MDFIPNYIIRKLLDFTVKQIGKKLGKDYRIVRILKELGLEKFDEKFETIYIFSLVEYSIYKQPAELVTLFSLPEVQTAMNNEIYTNKSEFKRILDGELHTNKEVMALKNSFDKNNLDKEIEEFKEIFVKNVQKSRSPKQIEDSNKINHLYLKEIERSFETQVEKYNLGLKKSFAEKYLETNYYVDLNGETRTAKKDFKFIEIKEKEKIEDKFDTFVYKPIENYINKWINNDNSKFLLILGEYGTGKSTLFGKLLYDLVSNIYENENTILKDLKQRTPLLFNLRDFEISIEKFIIPQLNENGIEDINYKRFTEKVENGEFIIFFDGFDEMSKRNIDDDEKQKNFNILLKIINLKNSKVILTCRDELFKNMEEMLVIFKFAENTNFEKIHLLTFDNDQIRQYLKTHTQNPVEVWENIDKTFDLKDLAKRPVLLDMIIKYLPELLKNCKNKKINASDLYKKCIDEEIQRKNTDLQFLIKSKNRIEILQKLSIWLYKNNDSLIFDISLLEPELQLKQYFNVKNDWEFEKYLNEFLVFSFLLPEKTNYYRFSHKSFRDYLISVEMVTEINKNKIDNFGSFKLTEEIINFILEQNPYREKLLELILTAKNLNDNNQWQGTNAANILLKIDDKALKANDLTNCILNEVQFNNSDLTETIFENTSVCKCNFSSKSILKSKIKNSNFENSILDFEHNYITNISEIVN